MDNLTLGYSFQNLFAAKLSGRISASVQNVFTISKYSGIDPECGAIDSNIWPRPRTYTIGLNNENNVWKQENKSLQLWQLACLFFQVVSMIWMSYLWIPQWKQQTKLIPMRKATLKDFIKYTQFGRYPDKTAAAVQIFQALMQEILHYYAVGGLYKNSQPMKWRTHGMMHGAQK